MIVDSPGVSFLIQLSLTLPPAVCDGYPLLLLLLRLSPELLLGLPVANSSIVTFDLLDDFFLRKDYLFKF